MVGAAERDTVLPPTLELRDVLEGPLELGAAGETLERAEGAGV